MRARTRSSRLCDDRGSATAETAIVLPGVVMMVALLILTGLGLGAQVRLESAARAAAREMARGESDQSAVATARRISGEDVAVTISADGAWVSVQVRRELRAPAGLLAGAAWSIEADAQARREPHLVGDGGAP